MSSAPYQQAYNAFWRSLQSLQQSVEPADRAALQSAFRAAQQIFQQQIIPLDTDPIESHDSPKLHSIQVEINKQMRLLATDLLFLQAARLSATASQRQQQISDRVEMLLRYCEAVLEQ
ncbi:heterocyst frequency control protein PatD [Phormidium tenue FACHB-886]|nr:heterocyst frequency control protein PatD [Phormidium tenue FACHB-886]